MQIKLFRDDEHMVGFDEQAFRDQLNRHFGIMRENLVESGGHGPQVIHDNGCNTQIDRQMPQQTGV